MNSSYLSTSNWKSSPIPFRHYKFRKLWKNQKRFSERRTKIFICHSKVCLTVVLGESNRVNTGMRDFPSYKLTVTFCFVSHYFCMCLKVTKGTTSKTEPALRDPPQRRNVLRERRVSSLWTIDVKLHSLFHGGIL